MHRASGKIQKHLTNLCWNSTFHLKPHFSITQLCIQVESQRHKLKTPYQWKLFAMHKDSQEFMKPCQSQTMSPTSSRNSVISTACIHPCKELHSPTSYILWGAFAFSWYLIFFLSWTNPDIVAVRALSSNWVPKHTAQLLNIGNETSGRQYLGHLRLGPLRATHSRNLTIPHHMTRKMANKGSKYPRNRHLYCRMEFLFPLDQRHPTYAY